MSQYFRKANPQICTNKYVIEFYDTRFRVYANDEDINNDEAHQKYEFIISIMICNKHSYPNKTESQRKFISLFESIFQRYSKKAYDRLFKVPYVCDVFKILMNSGFIENMIQSYPKLYESRETYHRMACIFADYNSKSIMDFK